VGAAAFAILLAGGITLLARSTGSQKILGAKVLTGIGVGLTVGWNVGMYSYYRRENSRLNMDQRTAQAKVDTAGVQKAAVAVENDEKRLAQEVSSAESLVGQAQVAEAEASVAVT
jgi:hypothetical protein